MSKPALTVNGLVFSWIATHGITDVYSARAGGFVLYLHHRGEKWHADAASHYTAGWESPDLALAVLHDEMKRDIELIVQNASPVPQNNRRILEGLEFELIRENDQGALYRRMCGAFIVGLHTDGFWWTASSMGRTGRTYNGPRFALENMRQMLSEPGPDSVPEKALSEMFGKVGEPQA